MIDTSKLCAAVMVAVAVFVADGRVANSDIVYDFSINPIIWDTAAGTLTWDANGDLVDDFSVSVLSGFIDPGTGLYVIDNLSTSSGGIEKTFVFSLSSLDPNCPVCSFNLLGFDFYSQKNIEPGGGGGAGSINVDVFDDVPNELVSGLNVSGSLGSNPTQVLIPGDVTTQWFELAIDLANPPNNDDAQVIIGNLIFNGGTITCGSFAVPEPGTIPAAFLMTIVVGSRARRRMPLH